MVDDRETLARENEADARRHNAVDEPQRAVPVQSANAPRFGDSIVTAELVTSHSAIMSDVEQPPLRWREMLAVVLLVALCDVTIYRGYGYAGYALLFAAAPALLWLGALRPRFDWAVAIVGIMLAVLAAKAIWCGSLLIVAAGFGLLVVFAMTLSGQRPYVLESILFASQTIAAGFMGLKQYARSLGKIGMPFARVPWLNALLPLVALVVFGTIFILANPDLLASVSHRIEQLLTDVREWLLNFSPLEILFCAFVLWIAVGLLRPLVSGPLFEERSSETEAAKAHDEIPVPSMLYPAIRNTLLTVIGLFAIYLVFEYATLWFREFPDGFHYSGYAHEGAAWLTFALALATIVLSLVFRGGVLRDPRLRMLRLLAWIWSIQNFILALAVFNRLFIYINFNGMTRMRMVGLFGISTVVVGFIWVLWKITHQRNFVWLMRRHLWTLAVAVYLYALLPVDTIVVSYNVERILAGDPAPSVQITVHPINSEGTLQLLPLLECGDPIIREGVRAMLVQRRDDLELLAERRQREGWTAYQIADQRVLNELRAARKQNWGEFTNRAARERMIRRFREYAYQWY